MFGIPYKPFRQPSSYKQNTGPAFDDELEFERELSVTITSAATSANRGMVSDNPQATDPDGDDVFDVPKLELLQ